MRGKIKWLKQIKKKNCGQLAVAMVTGKSIEKVENYFGHDHGTKSKDLAAALKHFGFSCSNRLLVMKERPICAIAKLKYPSKSGWHWVVVYKDKIYDGVWGQPDGTVEWPRGAKLTSYIPIEAKNVRQK